MTTLTINFTIQFLMQISGDQLLFLIQVLKDSLDIQMGYDWSFKYKKEQRSQFYEKFIQTILSKEHFSIDVDINKLKDIK